MMYAKNFERDSHTPIRRYAILLRTRQRLSLSVIVKVCLFNYIRMYNKNVTVHEGATGQAGSLHHKGFTPFGLCQNRGNSDLST